jgi:TRAP-type C4-dicarboxylate transport system permease small subunit
VITGSRSAIQTVREYIPTDPVALSATTAVLAVAATFGGMRVYRRYVRRIRNSDYVTSGMLEKGITVKGVVTRYAGYHWLVFRGSD